MEGCVTRKQRLVTVGVLSLSLLVCAVWCFYLAEQCFNGGIMWVAITSSNPHPSETARVMGHYWMSKATNWFWSGTGFLVLIPFTLLINYWISRRRKSQSPANPVVFAPEERLFIGPSRKKLYRSSRSDIYIRLFMTS